MSGFQFMPHVFDMISASPQASMNLDYNLWQTKFNSESIIYMGLKPQASAFLDYPAFGIFGNNLLNPNLAIGQVMNSFGNCNFNNGWNFGDMFNRNNGFNFNNTSPFGPSSPSNNETSAADQVKQAEYDKLKKILTAYRDNNTLSDSMKAKINGALNKSGKIDERLDALKAAAKVLDDEKIQKVILSDEDVLGKLDNCGYNTFEPLKLKSDGTDTKLKNTINKLKQDLNKKPAEFDGISTFMAQSSYENILRTISFWNDGNSTHIINRIAEVKSSNENELTLAKGAVENVVNSLLNKSTSIQDTYHSDFTKLKTAHKEVEDVYKKVQNDFSTTNLNALSTKFDNLYAILRLTIATAVGAEIKNNYQKVLKDATGKDIIPDDFIVAETEADLKKEGISIPEVDAIEEGEVAEDVELTNIDSMDTPEEKIEALKGEDGGNAIVETAKKGVYKTNTTSKTENPHFYMISGDKLVELNDVVNIDSKGECTMKNGSTKPLNEAKKSITEVDASDIKNYKDTLDRINKLVKDETLKVCPNTKLNGETLYKSKGLQSDKNPQYFIVRNGKLMQIVCKYVHKNGTIATGSGDKQFDKLTENDFKEISDNEILKEDEKEAIPPVVQDLLSNGALRETKCKKPMVYYSDKTKKYYIVKGGALKELKDVKFVYDNGRAKKTDGKMCDVISATLQNVDTNKLKKEKPTLPTNETLSCSADEAGKQTRESLYNYADKGNYKIKANYTNAIKGFNTFMKYDNLNDIVDFIDGYESERNWFYCNNEKFCAKLLKCSDPNQRKALLAKLAKKVLRCLDKAEYSHDTAIYKNVKSIVEFKNESAQIIMNDDDDYSFSTQDVFTMANKLDEALIDLRDNYVKENENQEEKKE